jgi:asparagine synthase (glutamine-hydrolysing)
MKPMDLAHHLEAAVIQGETLITNTHAVAKFLLSRVVHEAGYKVVLTGEGADEVFGGYPFFKKDMILHNTKGQDQKMIQLMLAELQRTNTVSRGLMLAEQQTKVSQPVVEALGFIPAFLEATFAIGAMMADVVNWDYFANSKTQDHVHEMLRELDFEGQVKGREPVHQSMYLFSKTIFPNYVLALLGDRMEMAHSVEGRVPFLDHELVELVAKMPVAYKINGLTEKYILREAARDVLTDTLYKRQKHPFQAPPSTLNVDDPLYTFVQDTLRSGIDRLPFYKKGHYLAILDKIPHMTQAQKTGVDAALMVAVSSVILNRHFNLS